MDVIDASDFVYTPLLALEPQYLAYAMLHLHSADGSNEVNVHTGKARRSNSTEVILQFGLVFSMKITLGNLTTPTANREDGVSS